MAKKKPKEKQSIKERTVDPEGTSTMRTPGEENVEEYLTEIAEPGSGTRPVPSGEFVKKHKKPDGLPTNFMVFVNGKARFEELDFQDTGDGFILWLREWPRPSDEIVFYDPSTCDVIARYSASFGIETWE